MRSLLLLLLFTLPSGSNAQTGGALPVPTAAGYWNARGALAGSARCAGCHREEAEKFAKNSMSKALAPANGSPIYSSKVPYTFSDGPWTYSIFRSGNKLMYHVGNGNDNLDAELLFAFGQGKAGQTYLFQHEGKFQESRVSYYAATGKLDLTVGAINSKPAGIAAAAGRVMDGPEPRNCFGCHTTGARTGTAFQLNDYEAGVQCESCHGPGAAHAGAMEQGKPVAGTIRSLRAMAPQESNEFCGACHRTWEAVMMMGIRGPNNARFPSYRLTNSKCFSLDDRRISCTTCHDPHGPLVEDDAYYDAKCAACHNQGNASIQKKSCPVGKKDCTSCHMQRVESKEAHHAFPDHWIRIVKSKQDYPD